MWKVIKVEKTNPLPTKESLSSPGIQNLFFSLSENKHCKKSYMTLIASIVIRKSTLSKLDSSDSLKEKEPEKKLQNRFKMQKLTCRSRPVGVSKRRYFEVFTILQ